MMEGTCLLCYSVARVSDIKHTYLQDVYEKLSQREIQFDSLPLCCICYTRLCQCEQLLTQIQKFGTQKQPQAAPLLNLCIVNANKWSLPDDSDELEVHPNVKEECMEEECLESPGGNETATEPVEDKHIQTEPTQYDSKPYDVKPARVEIGKTTCVVCDKKLDACVVKVKERGIQNFINSSIIRNDGKVDYFKGRTEISLHKTCRSSYNNLKCIKAVKRREERKKQKEVIGGGFDFENDCFLCGDYFTRAIKNECSLVTRLKTQDTIIRAATRRDDDWSRKVLMRIDKINLLEKNARYHYTCYSKFCYIYEPTTLKRRNEPSSETEEVMNKIYDFLENNHEDCQFSGAEIKETLNITDFPNDAVIKYHLKARYGDEVVITPGTSWDVCFIGNSYQSIPNSWYDKREKSDKMERRRIVEMASKIILQDIQSRPYDTEFYPPPHTFLNSAKDLCPDLLLLLLETILMPDDKRYKDDLERRILAIAHTIIYAVRPRTFTSPILLGVATLVYHKYGSRYLVDLLNSFGFCMNYDETLKFEVSSIAMNVPNDTSYFSQFAYGYLDDIVVDSRDSHTMVGIQCVTPIRTSLDLSIARLKRPPRELLGPVDRVPAQMFLKPAQSSFNDIIYKAHVIEKEFDLPITDLIWLYGKSQEEIPGWHSFTIATDSNVYHERSTEVRAIPFVNTPASNYSSILSALTHSAEQCQRNNIDCCIVTFDQPLYLKAQEIVKASQDPMIRNIIVRLGGFHLLSSFMAGIGNIMNGSGLRELWLRAYAERSIPNMMSGRLYERSLRAHVLSIVALFEMIKNNMDITTDEKLQLDTALHKMLDEKELNDTEEEELTAMKHKFVGTLQKLEARGPTAQLWVCYFRMITLVQQFIKAEKTGDWLLHLDTIKRMLPYFYAAGQFDYAKAANLYVQEMSCVQERMTQSYYDKFVKEGLFTVRTRKPCSGTWTDVTMTQSLIRSTKIAGGLARESNYPDVILGNWVSGLPAILCVTESVESFSNFGLKGLDYSLHKDGTKSNMERDAIDICQFVDWFSEHNPFPLTEDIMSISTGLVGDDKINPHRAKIIGQIMMTVPDGTTYGQIKFSRKDTIRSLATISSTVAIEDALVPIHPELILKRILHIHRSQETLKELLKYELAPYPLSLFDEAGMRKSNKSVLYDLFNPLLEQNINEGTSAFVIDGDHLLHSVAWEKVDTFENICKKYINFIKTQYSNTSIVFYNYDNEFNVINQERKRKTARGKLEPEVVILDSQSVLATSQESFLSNNKNKSRLIALLKLYLEAERITVYQTCDVETLVVVKAEEICRSNQFDRVFVVGENVDLLAILTTMNCDNLYMLKPGTDIVCGELYSPRSFRGDPKTILFCHAFTGCDSTSAIYKQSKRRACNMIMKNKNLRGVISIFNSAQSSPDEIAVAGEIVFCHLYGRENADLDTLRYEKYSEMVAKNNVDLASLPPSKSAACMHSLRVYYQIQKWKSHDLDPTMWGWQRNRTGLYPALALDNPIPDRILKIVSCKCKSSCRGNSNCTCTRFGLPCTELCISCTDRVCNGGNFTEDAEYDERFQVEMSNVDRSEHVLNKNLTLLEYEDDIVRPGKVKRLA